MTWHTNTYLYEFWISLAIVSDVFHAHQLSVVCFFSIDRRVCGTEVVCGESTVVSLSCFMVFQEENKRKNDKKLNSEYPQTTPSFCAQYPSVITKATLRCTFLCNKHCIYACSIHFFDILNSVPQHIKVYLSECNGKKTHKPDTDCVLKLNRACLC